MFCLKFLLLTSTVFSAVSRLITLLLFIFNEPKLDIRVLNKHDNHDDPGVNTHLNRCYGVKPILHISNLVMKRLN